MFNLGFGLLGPFAEGSEPGPDSLVTISVRVLDRSRVRFAVADDSRTRITATDATRPLITVTAP